MTNKLILLNGLARSGKDTCAGICKEVFKVFGQESQIIHFYDPLKGAVDSMFRFDERHRDGELKESDIIIRTDCITIMSAIKSTLSSANSPYLYMSDKELNDVCLELSHKFIQMLYEDAGEEKDLGEGRLIISPRRIYQLYGTELMRVHFDQNIWINFAEKAYEHGLERGMVTIISDLRFDNEAEWSKKKGGLIFSVQSDSTPAKVAAHSSENGISPSFIDSYITNNKEDGLDPLKQKISDLLHTWGFLSSVTTVIDYRKVDIKLLPGRVLVGRYNVAQALLVDLKAEQEQLGLDCHDSYRLQLRLDIKELERILLGINTELLRRTNG